MLGLDIFVNAMFFAFIDTEQEQNINNYKIRKRRP